VFVWTEPLTFNASARVNSVLFRFKCGIMGWEVSAVYKRWRLRYRYLKSAPSPPFLFPKIQVHHLS
jgi:hypothetical protein